jgi:hypothetical protein
VTTRAAIKRIDIMSAFLSESTELIAFVPDGAPQSSDFLRPEGFSEMQAEARPPTLKGDRLLSAQAMRLLMRLDRQLFEARAQWNQDLFRRVMRARSRAVLRLQRRWARVDPTPAIPLGSLKRRYHSNLTRHLYEPRL